jgi:hypothetical protein
LESECIERERERVSESLIDFLKDPCMLKKTPNPKPEMKVHRISYNSFVSLLEWNAAGTHYDCCTCRSETTNARGNQDQPPSKQDEKK